MRVSKAPAATLARPVMHGLPHHVLLPPFGAQAFEQIDHPKNPLGDAAVGETLR